MSTKAKVILAVITVITAFAVGRFSAPEKVKIEKEIVEVEKKSSETDLDRDKHKTTTTTEITRPDGTKEKTTKVEEDTKTSKNTTTVDLRQRNETETKEVTYGSNRVTISGMAGLGLDSLSVPIYGASITRPILGPIVIGLWGLTNKTGGVSLGLQF